MHTIGAKMKIVIIGYGGMGGYHAQAIGEWCGTEPGGIYDIDPERQAVARSKSIKVYSSPEEIWADKSVDAVIIATPNDVHYEYTLAAAKAGKHIICEKPSSLTSELTRKMFDAAKSAGVVMETHQNRRWDEDFLTARGIVDGKKIGDVYLIESRVMGANGIPGDWRKIAAKGGGMMLDWGVHLLDQSLQMIGGKVVRVYCEYSYIYGEEVEDGFDMTAEFDNGIKYRTVVRTDCFRALPRWQLYGTEGTATINDWDITGGITRIRVKNAAPPKGIKAGNGFTKTMAPHDGSTVDVLPLDIVRAPEHEFYRNFCAACKGTEKPTVTAEQVVRVFTLMEAAAQSAAEHKVIKCNI